MKTLTTLVTTIAVCLAFLLIIGAATQAYTDQSTYFSCDNCSDCNDALDNSTYSELRLSQSFNNSGASTCLLVDVADYTLNCADYHINGSDSPTIGIRVTTNATIQNCELRDFPQGIVVAGSKATLTSNTIINSTTEGILIDASYVTATQNNLTGSYQGIEVSDTGAIINNNDFSENNKDLYLNSAASNTSVKHNRFTGNGTNEGIDARVVLRGHTIYNNTLTGYAACIYSAGSIGNNISTNTLSGCTLGIQPSDGDNIQDNSITNSTTGIFFVATDNGTLVKDNTITNTSIGLRVNGSSNVIASNTITNNTIGIILGGTSNTIANNTITSSDTVGISLQNSVTALIYNNYFNNTLNKQISGTSTNYWNTAQGNGNNIVGYQVIGGNAWFTPTDGYSLGCADTNKDGFCDNFFGSTGNVDNYPLSLQGIPPSINAQTPANNAYNDSSDPATQQFNCTAGDENKELASISLYIWNASNNISYSDPKSVSGNNASAVWSGVSLANGTYTWNCLVTDEVGASAWGTNYTYKINYTDNETPNVTAQAPSDRFGNDNGVQVLQQFYCALEDNYDLRNVSLYLSSASNTSFGFNQSASVDGTSAEHTFTQMIGTGTYTWNCLVNDEEGNLAWGDNYTLFINGTRNNVTNLNTLENFTTIQAAIEASNTLDGHVLSIPDGEFYENINVTKALTLRGAGTSGASTTTEVGAEDTGSAVITIMSNNVTIDNMILTRAGTSNALIASDVQRLRLTNLSIQDCDQGIILENITTLTLHTITFSNVNLSINASSLSGATLQSITAVANNRTAIHLQDGTDLTMTSVTANIANATAILLENITGGALTSITARNGITGLELRSVTDLVISGLTITGHNSSGLRLINSGSNSLGNVYATDNSEGIYIQDSSFVTLSNSKIKSNARGIILNNSDGSIVTDNNVSLNTNIGLLVLSTTNADIYDNYFGNNNNTYDTGTNEYHKSGSGTNIIGGTSIGGNFYGYNGTGCSVDGTLTDTDGDRVADSGTCSIPGGSSIDRSPLTFNYVAPPEDNTTGSGGGSSGGGGGSYDPPTITKHAFVTVFNNVEQDDEILWSLTSPRPVMRQLSFTAGKAAERLELSFTQYDLDTEPDIIPKPLEGVSRYLKIDPIGLYSHDAEDVEFLMDLGTGLEMYIYDNSNWVQLDKTKEDLFWRVKSPHLSWFAIGKGGKGSAPEPEAVCGDGVIDDDELCDGSNLDGQSCASRIPGTEGTLACTASCTFNTQACKTPPPVCSKSCGTDGTCNSLCASDSVCPTDPDCGAPITCPYSCSADDRCVTGCESNQACLPDPDCSIDPNEEKPGNIFGILLWVLLGLVLLGGGGAAAYFFLKKEDVTSMFPKAGATGGTGGSGLANTMLKEDAHGILGGSSASFGTGADVIPDSLVTWAHSYLIKGYAPGDVQSALVRKGWSEVQAEQAVNKAQKFNIL